MTAFAPLPAPDEVPPGMVHVGWICTARRGADVDGCLMPLTRALPSGYAPGEEVYLVDAQHHASWEPVYVRAEHLRGCAVRGEGQWRTDPPAVGRPDEGPEA